MEEQGIKLPIGTQTFSILREEGYTYVDKTECVYRMTHGESRYLFLSRPRRFGKSLLVSTLRSYFEGRKDLFEGLKIAALEKEWTAYPVLHFDLGEVRGKGKEALVRYLDETLYSYERLYGVNEREQRYDLHNLRLIDVVRAAHAKTGKRVALLIDDYDAPILGMNPESAEMDEARYVIQNFLAPMKSLDPHFHFVLITGIKSFAQMEIYHHLNNFTHVSMDEEYAAICGITEEEIRTYLSEGVRELAEEKGLTFEGAMGKLKENYDGYKFTWPSEDIYNPYSLLKALSKKNFSSYWFGSGTPTYLIEMLRKFNVNPQDIGHRECEADDFDKPTERMTDITPLLYQSGYITIKDCDENGLYTLGIPNREVRTGLMKSLLEDYVGGMREDGTDSGNTIVLKMKKLLDKEDMGGMLGLLKAFLSTVPYCKKANSEGHYQQLLYVIFSLLGSYVDVEVHTSRGRVDMVIRTAERLYVVELKLNFSADAAMEQINLKDYAERFTLCGLPVVKVGIDFDPEKRTLREWKIE